MPFDDYAPGTKTMTNPGVLGTSDSSGRCYPVRVFFVSLSAAGTAGVLQLHNGVDTASTMIGRIYALANSSETWDCSYGMLFTSGCYVHMTTGSMKVAVQYWQESM
jgi:hypothetical protein